MEKTLSFPISPVPRGGSYIIEYYGILQDVDGRFLPALLSPLKKVKEQREPFYG